MDIELKNVSLKISKLMILENINTTLRSGCITGILGENGSGKSSLLKCLAGLLDYSGSIIFQDEKEKRIAYIPQNPATPIGMTVLEFVLLGRTAHFNWLKGETEADLVSCKSAIESVSLSLLKNRYVDSLSGGEMQRAVLARAIAQQANVLILDEPTSALDIKGQFNVLSLLKKLSNELFLTIVISLHDLAAAQHFTDEIILLKNGKIVNAGKTPIILSASNLEAVFDIQFDVLTRSDGQNTLVSRYPI